MSAGPGTHLLALVDRLGIPRPRRLAKWMDKIGVDGAKKELPHIVQKVRENVTSTFQQDRVEELVQKAIEKAAKGEPPLGDQELFRPAPEMCVYRGPGLGLSTDSGTPLYSCQIFGECMLAGHEGNVQSCHDCKSKLPITDDSFANQWIDPLAIYDRHAKQTAALRDMLAGRSVFLAGGGPSANALPLESLARRGSWTMCVNNMAGHARFRPQAFVCTDPPEKFADSIWMDPQIDKFIPIPKLTDPGRGKLRTRKDGVLVPLERDGKPLCTQDCPRVWAVKRRDWMSTDESFFLDDAAPNGQYKKGLERTNERKTICTFVFAIRILKYLGAREVFLIGVDFSMDTSRGAIGNYAFPQDRTKEACLSNNGQYVVVNDWLCRMESQGVFRRFGMRVYNCNAESGLRAFPHVPFDVALERVCAGVEPTPTLANWYSK